MRKALALVAVIGLTMSSASLGLAAALLVLHEPIRNMGEVSFADCTGTPVRETNAERELHVGPWKVTIAFARDARGNAAS